MSNNCFYIKFIYDYQSFFGKEISFFLKNIINDFVSGKSLNRADLHELIDKILVFDSKEIQIFYTFSVT